MARIIEFLTVNLAVKDLDAALGKYKALGFASHPANSMPDPPVQITDVSMPIGKAGHLSLIAALGSESMVTKFIEKRGEGTYSIALRTDNLSELMEEWSSAGAEWIFPEPHEFPAGTPCVNYIADRFLGNWVKPSSMFGVLFEVFELQGEIRPFGED